MELSIVRERCRALRVAESELRRVAYRERIPARVVTHAVHRLRWRLLQRIRNPQACDLEIEPIVMDSLRRELSRFRPRVLRVSISAKAPPSPSPLGRCTRDLAELSAAYRRYLAEITELERLVLGLLEDRFTFAEIALCIDVPASRARATALAAKRKIRRIIRAPFQDSPEKGEAA